VSTQGRGHNVRTSAQAESCPHGYGIYEMRSRKSRKYFKKYSYHIVIKVIYLYKGVSRLSSPGGGLPGIHWKYKQLLHLHR